MSFLWRSSSDSSENLCKLCIEKDKRLSDYEVFFNEAKDVLNEKESSAVELQIKLSEKISIIEIMKKQYDAEKRQWSEDRKIWQETSQKYQHEAIEWENNRSKYEEALEDMNRSGYELEIKLSEKNSIIEILKKQYDAEKRQWTEDRKIWQETSQKYQHEAIEWENDRSKYEEALEDMNSDKMISLKYQKTSEEKIANLVHSLKEADIKYQNLMERITEQNVIQSDEIREREEDIISIYDKKIEEMIQDFDERENEWMSRESKFDLHIQSLEDLNNDLSIKIQELKYDQECMIEKHTQELKDQEEKWDKRVYALNENYDIDFMQYKKHFKQKEDLIEKEKAELMCALQNNIEKLRKENELLEESKLNLEKKIVDINDQNKTLLKTVGEKNEQLETELNSNKKNLETHYIQDQNTQQMKVQTLVNLDSDNYSVAPPEEEGKRKKNKSTKKKNNILHAPVQNGYTGCYHSYVETMDKHYEHEKKIDEHVVTSSTNTIRPEHVCIDIQEDDDFFLSNPQSDLNSVLCSQSKKLKKYQNQLKQYQTELDKLRIENADFATKIKTYECNSILQFNRNLRSGIPVKFFPYHTNYNPVSPSYLHSNQINNCTVD
jgi:hypothetical protein